MLCIIHFIWLVVILAFKHLDPVLRIGKYPVKICFPASVIIASHKEGGFAFVEHLLQGFVVELHFLKANSYLHPSLIGQFENLWQRRTSVVIQLNYEITIDLRLFLGLAFGFVIGDGYAGEQGIADNYRIFNRRLVIGLNWGCGILRLSLRLFIRYRWGLCVRLFFNDISGEVQNCNDCCPEQFIRGRYLLIIDQPLDASLIGLLLDCKLGTYLPARDADHSTLNHNSIDIIRLMVSLTYEVHYKLNHFGNMKPLPINDVPKELDTWIHS